MVKMAGIKKWCWDGWAAQETKPHQKGEADPILSSTQETTLCGYNKLQRNVKIFGTSILRAPS